MERSFINNFESGNMILSIKKTFFLFSVKVARLEYVNTNLFKLQKKIYGTTLVPYG